MNEGPTDSVSRFLSSIHHARLMAWEAIRLCPQLSYGLAYQHYLKKVRRIPKPYADKSKLNTATRFAPFHRVIADVPQGTWRAARFKTPLSYWPSTNTSSSAVLPKIMTSSEALAQVSLELASQAHKVPPDPLDPDTGLFALRKCCRP